MIVILSMEWISSLPKSWLVRNSFPASSSARCNSRAVRVLWKRLWCFWIKALWRLSRMNLVLWGGSVYTPPLNCSVLFLTLSRVIAILRFGRRNLSMGYRPSSARRSRKPFATPYQCTIGEKLEVDMFFFYLVVERCYEARMRKCAERYCKVAWG